MEEVKVEIRVGDEKVSGVLSIPNEVADTFCILCHGLLSSKESPKYKLLQARFSEIGIPTLRFDFRGCGKSSRTLKDTDLSTRVEDLLACMDFMEREFPGRALLMGSSLGGVVVTISCSKRDNIAATSLWATPISFSRIKEAEKENVIPQIGDRFREELIRYSHKPYIKNLVKPIFIHGSMDEIVPKEQAEEAFREATEPKKLVIVEGADHVFSKENHLKRAVDETVKWFTKWR